MSFILDALKKSETERQRQAGPALLEMRIVRPARRLPVWALVVGVLLIISVAVLAWLAWRPATAPATAAAPVAAPASSPTASTPASAAPAGSVPEAPVGVAAAAPGPSPAAPAITTAPAAAAAPSPAEPTGVPADDNPADTEPAVSAPAGVTREYSNAANLRTYAELGGSLPALRLDLHVYATNPAERYAFINMHKVREGEVTPDGVQVKEITRDGVVLDYHGTEFLLGRQ